MAEDYTQFSLRLYEEDEQALEQYMEEMDINTKAEAIRKRIRTAPTERRGEKLDLILEKISGDSDPGVVDQEQSALENPKVPVTESPADDSDAQVVVTDNGDRVLLRDLDPSKDLILDPQSIDFGEIVENTHHRLTAFVGAFNYYREHGQLHSIDERHLKNRFGAVYGVGVQTQDKYLDLMIEHGVVLPNFFADPQLVDQDQWDGLLQDIYGEDYPKRKSRGGLPGDPSEMLGGWWVEEKNQGHELYLSSGLYREHVIECLERMAKETVEKWQNKDLDEQRELWDQWRVSYRHLCNLAEERTSHMDDPVDADEMYNMMAVQVNPK